MVTVRRTNSISHSGVEGMKWGYNDGQRNGKRTAAEINKVADEYKRLAKYDDSLAISNDMESVYNEANSMLKYLGISLDLQSNDRTAAQTIAIYNNMKDSKAKFPTQHEWLKEFSRRLALTGYDMKAVDNMLDQNKDALNKMTPGTGAGSSSASNSNFVDAYKQNKLKREAVKAADKKAAKEASKSKKKDKEKDKEDDKETDEEKKKNIKHSENQNGNEVYHSGVKDMHWGVRRYQNPDGSLTPLGREHYGYKTRRDNSTVEKLSGTTAKEHQKIYENERNKRYSEATKATKTASTAINSSVNLARKANKIATKVEEANYRKKVSKMSNEELEKEISKALPEYEARVLRQQLEQKYNKIVLDSANAKRGREAAIESIEAIGAVAIASVEVINLIMRIKGI